MSGELAQKLVPDDASKRGYFDRVSVLVDLQVRLLADLGEYDAALEAAERGRARAFQDLLLSRALDAWASGAAATRVARDEPVEAPRATAGVALMPILSPSRDLAAASGKTGAAPPPPPIASQASARVPSLADVRRVAAAQQSNLLVYWVGQRRHADLDGDTGGRITMTRSAIGESALAVLARTAVSVSGLPARGPGGVAFAADSRAALRRLYDVLIEPVRAALPVDPGRATHDCPAWATVSRVVCRPAEQARTLSWWRTTVCTTRPRPARWPTRRRTGAAMVRCCSWWTRC